MTRSCFWPQCSNRERCAAHGSCVALAQREAIMATRKADVVREEQIGWRERKVDLICDGCHRGLEEGWTYCPTCGRQIEPRAA